MGPGGVLGNGGGSLGDPRVLGNGGGESEGGPGDPSVPGGGVATPTRSLSRGGSLICVSIITEAFSHDIISIDTVSDEKL